MIGGPQQPGSAQPGTPKPAQPNHLQILGLKPTVGNDNRSGRRSPAGGRGEDGGPRLRLNKPNPQHFKP